MKEYLHYESSELNPVHLVNIFMISIVLYLHHRNYSSDYFAVMADYRITYILQKFAVGGFFFFSGLKLATSNINYSAKVFFRKRFLRIYLLYLAALVLSSFTVYPYIHGSYPTVGTFLLHIFCLQTIFPNIAGKMFPTLWFVSVLFFCYLLFIALRNDINNTFKLLAKTWAIFGVASLLHLITADLSIHIIYGNFPIYILFFAFGMVSAGLKINVINRYLYLLAGLAGNALLVFIYNLIYINTWYEFLFFACLVVFSNISLYYFLTFYLKIHVFSSKARRLISIYSTASFCVFLFHHSIWSIMATLYPKGTFLQWSYIIFLGVPIIIASSYILQNSYNAVLGRLALHRSHLHSGVNPEKPHGK